MSNDDISTSNFETNIAIVAITKKALTRALELSKSLEAEIFCTKNYGLNGDNVHTITRNFKEFVGCLFSNFDKLIFVMATGIVVRSIAPYIKDKTTDPAVVVLDEDFKFAISLLSGHLGGANEMAHDIAAITGATPVITTATDINNVIAFDMVAKNNDCIIENINNLKKISSGLLHGEKINVYCSYKIINAPDEIVIMPFEDNYVTNDTLNSLGEATFACHDTNNILHKTEYTSYDDNNSQALNVIISNKSINYPGCKELEKALSEKIQTENCELGDGCLELDKTLIIRPRNLILGVGFKKGISTEIFCEFFRDFILKTGYSQLSIRGLATIDIKKDEGALIDFAKILGVGINYYSKDELGKLDKEFTYSSRVMDKIGIGSVSEPCAYLASNRGKSVIKKTLYKGVTFALSEDNFVLKF